jgi:hypothetical protein
MSSGSKAYWHSRGYKKAPLSKEARLEDRIKNGDFDVSYYQTLINQEKAKIKNVEAEVAAAVRGSERDKEEAVAYYRRKSFRKIQELTEKMFDDETRRLAELRTLLQEEFGHDWWDELIEQCEGGANSLYKLYKNKAQHERTADSI